MGIADQILATSEPDMYDKMMRALATHRSLYGDFPDKVAVDQETFDQLKADFQKKFPMLMPMGADLVPMKICGAEIIVE